MAIEMVPYSNFHDLNLDWVLKVVKEAEDIINGDRGDIAEIMQELQQAVEDAQASVEAAQTASQAAANASVNAVLSSNDAQDAASRARESAAEAEQTIADFDQSVVDAAGDWLEDHVDPQTGYVVDTSLSISGAAADSKTVGDRFTVDENAINAADLRLQIQQIELNRIASNIADPYDSTETYAAGDYCIYDNVLRVCIATTTSGAFNAADWDIVTVVSQLGGGGGGGGDLSNYYTKPQTNALLSQKVDNTYLQSNYYDKGQVDTIAGTKADQSALSDYYTQTQIDTMMSGKASTAALNAYYTKTEANTLLDAKADDTDLANYYTKSQIDALFASVTNPYPVGSIYMSINSTSPATLFGGTWEQLKDRFLLAAGDTYSAGATGGEASHQLTVQEMPSHNHLCKRVGTSLGGSNTGLVVATQLFSSQDSTIQNTGGNVAHNNMPPYLAVYMWKRTA